MLQLFLDKAKTEKLDLTAVQTWVVIRDLQRKVKKYGECPADLNEVRAMSDLTSNANLYSQEALNVADYDTNEIKILQRKLTPFEAKDIAPPEACAFLSHFDLLVERPNHELEGLRNNGDIVKPHWDEKLMASRKLRLSSINVAINVDC